MRAPSLLLLLLTYLGFVSLGLPDAITGVIWPSVSRHFGIPLGNLGVLLTAFTSGYLIASVSSAWTLQRTGVGGLLALSCALISLSLCGFGVAPNWFFYLFAAVVSGLGAGAIDTALNSYAAHRLSARQMSWLHGCWGVGATLGAMTAASVLARGLEWRWVFGILAVAMALLTLTFAGARRKWDSTPVGDGVLLESSEVQTPHPSLREAICHRVVWLQAIVFFVYVGIECSFSQWSFTLLTEHRGVSASLAGTAVSLYWASLTAGRFVLGTLADRLGIRRLILISVTAAAMLGVTFLFVSSEWISIAAFVALGAALAPLYPGLMSQTPARLGHFADIAVGFQVAAAMIGQLVIPGLGGLILKAHGLNWLSSAIGVTLLLLWLLVIVLLRKKAASPDSPTR